MRFMRGDICILCDDPGGTIPNLCDACARELPTVREPCVACGASAPPHVRLCGGCATRHPPVDRTICAVAYASPIDYLIGRLKFQRDLRVVPTLAGLVRRAVARESGVDWLVPVPVTPARLRERGFNQALEIAHVLSKGGGAPIKRGVHRRNRADAPQSSLNSPAARRANVAGAFETRAAIGGHVAIVDDVVTTGATVNALARCLKAAGAVRVDVWAVARTL